MKITETIRNQLMQGANPRGIALTCAIGATLAIFPILGSTTLLCVAAGMLLKLNQPILQAINYLLYPLQILLLPVFISWGARLTGSPPVSFLPKALTSEFTADPTQFMAKYGMAGLHGVLAWALIAPVLAWILFQIGLIVAKRWRNKHA